MIACPLPGELLADYFARALGRDETDQIDAHVFECDHCAGLYDAAGATPAELGPVLAIEGAPWDAERGEVLVACQRHYMMGHARALMTFRVYAEIAGTRREVGEYVVDHRVVDG